MRYFGRMPAALCLAVSVVLASTACTSGSDHDDNPKPTGKAPATVANQLTACAVTSKDLAAYTGDKTFLSRAYLMRVGPWGENGAERECLYNHGEFVIRTFTEPAGKTALYKQVVAEFGKGRSTHPIVNHKDGNLTGITGVWITVRGETKGVVFRKSVIGNEAHPAPAHNATVFMQIDDAHRISRGDFSRLVANALDNVNVGVLPTGVMR